MFIEQGDWQGLDQEVAKIETSVKSTVEILNKEFENLHNLKIIEIATGSGTISEFLPNDNKYVGIDISKGLLKKAYSRFKESRMKDMILQEIKQNLILKQGEY